MSEPALIAPTAIEFVIPGTPQQQGSKIVSRYGGMYDANKKLGPWRAEGIAAAQAAYDGPKITEPLAVTARFYFPRPKGHYGSGKNSMKVKPNAPTFHASAPDTDKLCRALNDVLTQAGTILDDRLIVQLAAVKFWTEKAPRTEVAISLIGTQP